MVVRRTHVFFVLFFLIAFDRAVQWGVRASELPWVCNSGGAWGTPISSSTLLIFSGLLIFFLVVLTWKQVGQERALLFLVAGGLGNFFDRLTLGCVVDYIHLLSFPFFNLADVYLTIGCLYWFWQTQRKHWVKQ